QTCALPILAGLCGRRPDRVRLVRRLPIGQCFIRFRIDRNGWDPQLAQRADHTIGHGRTVGDEYFAKHVVPPVPAQGRYPKLRGPGLSNGAATSMNSSIKARVRTGSITFSITKASALR